MIKIIITKPVCRVLKGTSSKGRPYELHIQTAYAATVDRETGEVSEIPDKFEIILPQGVTEPFGRGEYTLDPSSIYVDRDGRLAINPRLTKKQPVRSEVSK